MIFDIYLHLLSRRVFSHFLPTVPVDCHLVNGASADRRLLLYTYLVAKGIQGRRRRPTGPQAEIRRIAGR